MQETADFLGSRSPRESSVSCTSSRCKSKYGGPDLHSKSMNQPDKVANPARSQLNRGSECFPVPVRA